MAYHQSENRVNSHIIITSVIAFLIGLKILAWHNIRPDNFHQRICVIRLIFACFLEIEFPENHLVLSESPSFIAEDILYPA